MRIKSTCGYHSETQKYDFVYVQLVDWSIGSNTHEKPRGRDDVPPAYAYAVHTRQMSSVRPAKDLVLVECAWAYVRPITKHTDIVRIELINAHASCERHHAQCPGQDRCECGELAFMDIIHQDGIELGNNDSKAEQDADLEMGVLWSRLGSESLARVSSRTLTRTARLLGWRLVKRAKSGVGVDTGSSGLVKT